ncbi:hypothetical protein [Niveispirillum sp.]|uniref:hypothetical protein n=1 Tax=Niveispirillum sp. TaxID=1917217 RepID=UPI001B5AD841|nr:hypothetical protein [Niveispirillum sp.]MBP7339425.1 hypothetical protein [Niveispirillum sp.]
MRDVTMVWLLEWAYRVQRIGEADRLGLCVQERWERGLIGARSPLASGPRVDEGVGGLAAVHADAEAVHAAVLRLPFLTRGVIQQYAVIGGCPDWVQGATVVERYARDENGQPIRVYDGNRNFRGYRRERVVMVAGEDIGMCEDGLRLARDVWELWAGGVLALAGSVAGLMSHRVTGAGVWLRPWVQENAA